MMRLAWWDLDGTKDWTSEELRAEALACAIVVAEGAHDRGNVARRDEMLAHAERLAGQVNPDAATLARIARLRRRSSRVMATRD